MIKINPLPNIKQNIIQKTSQQILQKAEDTLSISAPVIKRLTDKKEINELADMFYNSVIDSFAHNSKMTKNPLVKLIHNIQRKILTIPFKLGATSPNYIIESIKADGKLLGGYSMTVAKDNTAFVNFMTLSPEVKGTKTSVNLLFTMGKRIADNAKVNNLEYISWTANTRNKKIISLLNRFNSEKKNLPLGEIQYKISVKDFSDTIDKYLR